MNQGKDGAAQKSQAPIMPGPVGTLQEDVIDLSQFLITLWRGKWWLLFCVILTTAFGGYYAYKVATPIYASTAVVILEPQQTNLLDIESAIGGLTGASEEVNSELEVLQSRSLMGKVVDLLDLTTDPEFNNNLQPAGLVSVAVSYVTTALGLDDGADEVKIDPAIQTRLTKDAAILALLNKSRVRNIPRSLVFEITVETGSAEKSATIADTIAELYVLDQLEVKFQATEQATQWLSGRVSELEVQLETAQAAVSNFSTSIDLVSIEALQAQEAQLKDVRDRAVIAAQDLETARQTLLELQAAEDRPTRALISGDRQLSELLGRVDTSDDIAAAFDSRYQQIVARGLLDVTRQQQQLQALEVSQDTILAQIERQSTDLIELQQLQREAEAVRLLYETFLQRLQEVSAQQGIQQADSRILSSAVLPFEPSAPRKSVLVAMSMLVGLFVGSAALLISEGAKSGFRSGRDLERLGGYSVLGQIPSIPRRRRHQVLSYLREKPTSAAAEAYRNLRTSLTLIDVDNPPKVIMSTSCVPGEGKTTNSIALAQNFTGLGKKVLLLEGDIRRRTFSEYFKDLPSKGLVSVVAGDSTLSDAITRDSVLDADVLVGGKSTVNAADIFASARFKDIIAELRDMYDYVIIDTPPVLVVPDARIIAETCDAVLFTVQWDKTSKAQIEEAMRTFHSAGQQISGFVLSQINIRRMNAYGYGGRYGAYATYGGYYDN